MTATSIPPELRWRCRRGILEVDLLLERFLEAGYRSLSAQEREAFRVLVEQPDSVLLGWLIGSDRPIDEDLAHVVQRIRAAY